MTDTPTSFVRPPGRRRAVALLLSLALLVACSGPVPSIQIALGTTAVAVLRGDSVDVDVALTRSGGATGAVTLSVTGLPANVTASFAPAALDGAIVDSVLTLSATPAALEGMPALTVVAAGTSLTAEATLDLTVESLGLTGQVVGLFGLPIAGVTVASQGETAFTDADGAFVLDGLATPYDLTLSAAFGAGAVHVFEGLTTAAPVLTPAFAIQAVPPTVSATVSGDVLGGAAVAADRSVIVCAEGLDVVVLGCDGVAAGGTAYALDLDWFEPGAAAIRVHAFLMGTAVDGTPSTFEGYETFDLSILPGGAEVRDFTFKPVATVLVQGSIVAADGVTLSGTLGSVRFGPRLAMQLFASTAVVGDVSVLMPAPSGATFDFTTIGSSPSGTAFAWTTDQGSDFGTLTVPAALAQVAPADAAVGVDLSTPFTSSGSDEVRTYLFTGAGPLLARTTTRSSVTVPDPGLGGFAFPGAAAYTWYVFGHGSADPDAVLRRSVADYVKLLSFSGMGGPGYDEPGSFALGTDRDFTFAP